MKETEKKPWVAPIIREATEKEKKIIDEKMEEPKLRMITASELRGGTPIGSIVQCTHIDIEQMPHAKGLPLPEYKSEDAAGMDLIAANHEPIVLKPGKMQVIPTGIKVKMPVQDRFHPMYDGEVKYFQAEIRPRSGLAFKYQVSVLNTPGTIDADYRGEIKVILVNFGDEPFTVERGDRVAQMVVTTYEMVAWNPVDTIEVDTDRGEGRFNSTGHKAKEEK